MSIVSQYVYMLKMVDLMSLLYAWVNVQNLKNPELFQVKS